VSDLASYIEVIVEPTYADFRANPSSRRAFLTCVAIFHAVDRVAFPKKPAGLRAQWCRQSLEFRLVDIVAHHFKHVQSSDERIPVSRPGLPIGFALGFNEDGDEMELRNFDFVMRDAITFLKRKAAEMAPGGAAVAAAMS
jgi:hypothetical protein